MIAEPFVSQVELLLRVLPHVAGEEIFALKGGTAINLFVREMPRLSVDIDLTYLPIEDRETSLSHISEGLESIGNRIRKGLGGASITRTSDRTSDVEVTYQELVNTRERLISEVRSGLTNQEREFLLSLKQGRPKWNLVGVEHLERLPALQWKLMNIKKMDRESHRRAVDLLKKTLEL